ncbi:hypothetical protein SAMN05421819_4375 [Bryocella elongata]|uniref:Uncharacterized protein n=1 Tax=Bryocella elongata TaxID=863522 RepID=A0A1H6CA12_9BACT|nr:hypothetical protein [Bryocella elongata]SEG69733.1 hypothetical protein SAMN05421819_4375 [Bryocella elongata]
MATNEQISLGRAKNAVLSYFERRMSVPKIYLDAGWADGHVDVLAIDRDGVGDVHAALLFLERRFPDGLLDIAHDGRVVQSLMEKFTTVPAHFKYIVAVDPNPVGAGRFDLADRHVDTSFAPDGIGRVGFLAIEIFEDGEVATRLVIKPERFRAKVAPQVDSYIQNHAADWEIRA